MLIARLYFSYSQTSLSTQHPAVFTRLTPLSSSLSPPLSSLVSLSSLLLSPPSLPLSLSLSHSPMSRLTFFHLLNKEPSSSSSFFFFAAYIKVSLLSLLLCCLSLLSLLSLLLSPFQSLESRSLILAALALPALTSSLHSRSLSARGKSQTPSSNLSVAVGGEGGGSFHTLKKVSLSTM